MHRADDSANIPLAAAGARSFAKLITATMVRLVLLRTGGSLSLAHQYASVTHP